jgi:hypothetical protein
MCEIDNYGFATVDYWNENISTFKNIFNGVKTFINFSETPAEIFDLFQLYNAERLVFKKYPTTMQETTNAIAQLTKYCIIFARTYQTKYNKLLATEKLEYNPIENYSMTENGTDVRTPDLVSNTTASGTSSGNATDISTNTSAVTTYDNTADFINQNKGTADTTNTTSTENSSTGKTTTTGTEKTTHEFKRSGNIGVTTSQQMIQSEREIADFSALSQFVNDIANLICLSIY